MNKEQFLKLIREISGQIQDIEVRRDYLENNFIQYGYSIESGYKVVSHYYSELKKAREGQPTVYDGKFIHNEINKTFALVTNGSCLFKMTFSGFEGLGILFEKPHQQTETANQYEQSVRINYLASKEDAERLGCKVGEPVSYIPEPINIDEMFEQLQNIYGLRVAEAYQGIFKEKYGNGNIKTVSDELNEIKKFIAEAEKLPTTETFKKVFNNKNYSAKFVNNNLYLSHLVEYSRLKFGYYRKEQFIPSFNSFFSSYSIDVYGKYFLYKQWLEDKLVELKIILPTQQTIEQMKENLLQLEACSKGDEIIDEIDKIYLDKSLITGRKIVLIGDRKDIFKLGEKHIRDGVACISFDEKKYIFPEWKIKDIVDCCKDRLKKLKRRQTVENTNVEHNFKSVNTTISESCIEIVAHPELYRTLNKHFEILEDKQRENRRTGHIISKFNDKSSEFIIENQHLTGQSETKKSVGTVDFAVLFNKEKIAIGEAVNSSAQNTNSIDQNIVKHLKKLTQNYNRSTLSDLILLVYYEGNSGKFYDSYSNYLKHFAKSTESVINPTKAINDITSDFVTNSSSIKIAKSIHSYSGNIENEFSIYHFYIDFSEK